MTLLNHTPTFDARDAARLARVLYELDVTAVPLPSERDQNFLLHAADGSRSVLKIANGLEDTSLLDAQQQAMDHVAAQTGCCPRVLPTRSGALHAAVRAPAGNRTYRVWRLSYLPGRPLGDVGYHSPTLLHELGHCLGRVDAALSDFDHPAIHRTFHWDLAQGPRVIAAHAALIADETLGQQVSALASAFEQHAAPLLPQLRRSAIHNDANDYNVLVESHLHEQRVVGLVDFGDMVFSCTVFDLAIACAYAILDKPDPLEASASIVRGYHAVHPLQPAEIAALWSLIGLRLAMSVCLAAHQQQQRPADPYLAISQAPIRRTLPRLLQVNPAWATAVLRHACNLPAAPYSDTISNWLYENSGDFAPVLGHDLRQTPVTVLDLSVESPHIQNDPLQISEPALTARITAAMAEAGAVIGVGRYDEARLIYTEPMFATGPRPTDPRRSVHLGIDLFAPPGTAVHAPLHATVHAFADNAAPQDYGPVIVLRHAIIDGHEFFTLYGHLSRESLDGLHVGQTIRRGERFATLGTAAVNGGWPPHLHFQVITDLLGLGSDFPGVGTAAQRDVWSALCPDPNLILGIPADRFPARPPHKAATLAERRLRIGPSLSIAYREPVKIVRGWRQWLYDETGRRYLDAYNNVPHVGHGHPHVVEAACRQMALLNTNTRYLHDNINRLAERLSDTLPDPLNVCFFMNSASEANELALRLARAYTGQRDMLVLEAAYHGHTNALIDISPYKHTGPGGRGAPEWVHTAPIPDVYRGPHRVDDPQAGVKYARDAAEIVARLQAAERGLAGFIAETLPSVGGQIVLPEGYLARVYTAVRAAGGVCIADEVQTGYGRIGTHFYGFQAHGVVPDIVVLGKPIGNGHPLAAVITTPEIANAFDNGMEFFSTFGGNTVSCAVGLAVLDVMEAEGLQAHALRVGERMLTGLRPFLQRHTIVGDVRGSGLFLGVELVHDRATLEPAGPAASFVANRMREAGILLGTDGPFHNVIKIRPPMPFSEENADFLVGTLDEILAQL